MDLAPDSVVKTNGADDVSGLAAEVGARSRNQRGTVLDQPEPTPASLQEPLGWELAWKTQP